MLSKFIFICSVLALWKTKPGNLFKKGTTSAARDRFSGNTPKSVIFRKFIQYSVNTLSYASQMFKLLNKPLSISVQRKKIHLTPVRLFLIGQRHD